MEPLDVALLILRLGVGLTFAAHGAQKLFGWWGGPGFGRWRSAMDRMGFRPVGLFAAVSSVNEVAGGLMLALGVATPVVAAALVAQTVVIIVKVHLPNGFFVTKSGIEFALNLATCELAIALVGPGALSVDGAVGFVPSTTVRLVLLVLGAAAGFVALAVPRINARREAAAA